MKRSLLALLCLSFAFNTHAEIKSFKASYEINKSVEEVLGIYIDFENTCMEGCKYFSPSIKQMIKLEVDFSPNAFYIWTHVDDIKDVRYFSKINITGSASNTISVLQMQVSKKRGEQLAQLTGYSNAPVLKSLQFKTDFSVSPNSRVTQIEHSSSAQYGMLLRILSKKIYTSLVTFSEATKTNLNTSQ